MLAPGQIAAPGPDHPALGLYQILDEEGRLLDLPRAADPVLDVAVLAEPAGEQGILAASREDLPGHAQRR